MDLGHTVARMVDRAVDAAEGVADGDWGAVKGLLKDETRLARSLLGLAPEVKELGETEDPQDLVPGRVEEIDQKIVGLGKLGDALARTGDAFRQISVGEWHGKAAEAFQRYFANDAPQWDKAGEAFHQAAAALRRYRDTLAWAQQQAAEAIRLYREGQEATERARAAYDRQVEEYNELLAAAQIGSASAPSPPEPFVDPGEASRQRARAILDQARADLRRVGDEAAGAVRQAADQAPAQPGLLTRLRAELADQVTMARSFVTNAYAGVAEAVETTVKTVRAVNPLDPYNLTHPGAFLQNSAAVAAGLVHSVAHPQELVKGLLAADEWGENPGKAFGETVFNVVTSITGGGAAGAGARAAAGAGRRAVTEAAEQAATRAAQEAAEQAVATAGRQAVTDAATAGWQAATDVATAGTGIRDALAADQQAAATLRESGATLASVEAKLDNLDLNPRAVDAPSATSALEHTPASESPPAIYTPEDYAKWRAKFEEAPPRHEEPVSRPTEHQPGHENASHSSGRDRASEKTGPPERPQRPEEITAEYLTKYLEWRDEAPKWGLRPGYHPGTEHPTFEPGGELPEGLTRTPPKDITEGSVHRVQPEDVHAGERHNPETSQPEKRPVVWRYNENFLDEPLYRRVAIDPEPIINKGMDVGDPKMLNLELHQGNITWEQSGLSSWTRSPEYAADFKREAFDPGRAVRLPDGTYAQTDYIWKGYHRGGIDMDATWHDLGELNPYHEGEVTIPGGVRTEQLEGYWPRTTIYTAEGEVLKTTFGEFVPNPNFKLKDLVT